MTNPIDEQIERLRNAVALFYKTFGRVPTVAFDADGVIYDFENPYIAYHNRVNPDLPPVVGPFEQFDVGYNQTPEVAEALQESMRSLDWTELKPFPEAFAVLPVLVEVGLDLSIATAHRVDNVYSASAKVYQFHHDFEGYFDKRLQIGIDKTRVVADFLVDDRPEIEGELTPMWEHLRFTQRYNRDLPGVHVVWETMFEVLASVIEAKIGGRTLTPIPAPVVATGLPDLSAADSDEPVLRRTRAEAAEVAPAWVTDEPELAGPVDTSVPTVAMPWVEDEPTLSPAPASPLSWDDIISGEKSE